ncbi:alpha/beta-hydrolase [Serendipita vermifera]|nr:alpha/beta-hydrolase [Serendipita vermifera]
MEKNTPPRSSPSYGRTKLLLLLGVTIAAAFNLYHGYSGRMEQVIKPSPLSNCSQEVNYETDFDWSQLPVSRTPQWKHCYHNRFECARLEVPLDYHNRFAGSAAIALIRLPALVPRRIKGYKGPILFNPGGPGGSGVSFVLNAGKLFQTVLGVEYDIVGFDPRGVGFTTPVIDIFETPLDRAAWQIRMLEAPFVNESSSALGQFAGRAKLINTLIEEKAANATQHATTPVVATDMLRIITALGQDKLQFWGFSYGTILGSTFATLYPNSVGRVVIDGVMDPQDYYDGNWSSNLKNTDQGLDLVFQQCAEAGEECALHESTAGKVKERYLRLERSLDEHPVVVHMDAYMGLIHKKFVKYIMFLGLYTPYNIMKPLFETFKDLEAGDGVPLLRLLLGVVNPKLPCNCDSKPPPRIGGEESQSGIMCSDAQDILDDDAVAMQDHFEKLANISHFADIWSTLRYRCIGRKVKGKWGWHGPVTGQTSFPLLLVDNTYDPVTPDAQKVSKAFDNSIVLTQESAGHCSLAAASFCTIWAIRSYFRNGTLPPKGTKCDIESHMFLQKQPTELYMPSTQEEANVLDALREMTGKVPLGNFIHPSFSEEMIRW